MLLWVFRAIFWVVVIALLFVNVSSTEISGAAGSVNFVAVLVSGLGMAVFVFLLDVLTPKRKLSALAGVFFGLLVGLLISLVLAAVVDMVSDSYKIDLLPETSRAILRPLMLGSSFVIVVPETVFGRVMVALTEFFS